MFAYTEVRRWRHVGRKYGKHGHYPQETTIWRRCTRAETWAAAVEWTEVSLH